MALVGFKAPALPLPSPQYDVRQQNELNRSLRLYFNRLDSLAPNEAQSYQASEFIGGSFTGGNVNASSITGFGRGLEFPYGSFYDTTDQIAGSTTVAYAITLNTTSIASAVRVTNSSRISVDISGIYNLQFSVQLVNDTNASQDIDIWFRKNGTNIPNSNSRFGLSARKSPGDFYHTVAALNFFIDLNAGEYVELMWRTTNVDTYIEHYAAPSSPTRPAIPSVIVTMSWVSALPAQFTIPFTGALVVAGHAPTIKKSIIPGSGAVAFLGHAPTVTIA